MHEEVSLCFSLYYSHIMYW